MKTKWQEFIEGAIPNGNYREVFKNYVKNSILGRSNNEAITLYGTGANGKSTLMKIIRRIVSNSIIISYDDIKTNMDEIEGSILLLIEDLPNEFYPSSIQQLINKNDIFVRPVGKKGYTSNNWPNIMIATNRLDDELSYISIFIDMPNVPSKCNPHMADELLESEYEIREWFLN